MHSLKGEAFQNIDLGSIQLNDVKKIFVNNNGIDRNVRMFKFLNLPFNPQNSQMLLNDGSPAWNRYYLQNGILDVFGFSINLEWTNFPIKGSFLPFIHFLLYSNGSKFNEQYLNTNSLWAYNPSEYYLNTIYHVQPDGVKKIVTTNDNNIIVTDQLNYPGFHSLETDGFKFIQTAVNIPNKELYSDLLTMDHIGENIPTNIEIIPINQNLQTKIQQARIGIEIWRYILYIIIVLLIFEMMLSNAKK